MLLINVFFSYFRGRANKKFFFLVIAMSKNVSSPVTNQPHPDGFNNHFSLMGNEIFLQEWTFKEGCGGCSAIYHTILTDTRLLIRSETKSCCAPDYNDVSMFLRDIAEMRVTTENHDCCSKLCAKCCACCCHGPKLIELKGVFGSQVLHIPKADMENMQITLPAAIGNHKLVNHRSFLQ
jgi:hypothetical protein